MLDTLLDTARPLLRLFSPTACVGCESPTGPLCPGCALSLEDRNPWTRSPRGTWGPLDDGPPGDTLALLGPYPGLVGAVVREAKRGENPALVAALARAGVRALGNHPGGLPRVEALVHPPAPSPASHPAPALARALGRALSLPVLSELVDRVDTPVRTRFLPETERKPHVERLFRGGRPPPPGIRRVLLVDDVWTTGATLGHLTRLIRGKGLEVALRITLAFTPRSRSLPPMQDPGFHRRQM